MTGKFKEYDYLKGIVKETFLIGLVCLGLICVFFDVVLNLDDIALEIMIISSLIIFIVMCAESVLTLKGCFTADENYVIFKVGLKKHIFGYYEILSAKVITGVTHNRYGSFPHVELILTLKNGKTMTFCDGSFPDEAISTPEKHKKFLDYHPFTFLSNYINQRAGEYDNDIK